MAQRTKKSGNSRSASKSTRGRTRQRGAAGNGSAAHGRSTHGLIGSVRETVQEAASQTLATGREFAAATPRVIRRAGDDLHEVGTATVATVKRHPVASSAISAGVLAGVAVLVFRALREPKLGPPMSLRERGRREKEAARRGLLAQAGDVWESTVEGMSDAVEAVREGTSDWVEYAEEGVSTIGTAIKGGAVAVGEGKEQGYTYGKDKVAQLWEDHPLVCSAGVLALGVAAGIMLPGTGTERKLVGKKAGELSNRVQSSGRKFVDQGRELAGRVASEAGKALRRDAEREGLNPAKVARKVKRIAGHLKKVATEAVADV